MVNVVVLDFETSTGDKATHGPSAKDPANDFYTIIYGDSPDNVTIEHKEEGFKRKLPNGFVEMLAKSDVLIGHNLAFDLSYIWHTQELKDFILKGGEIYDTQTAEYLMSGQRHSFASLGELQNIYLGTKVKIDRISKLYRKGVGADRMVGAQHKCKRFFAMYEQYSYDDGITTLQIYEKQQIKLDNLGMRSIIKMYNRYLLSLINCMNTGILIDTDKCQKTLREFKIKELELMEQAGELIKEYWRDDRLPDFNVNSPTHKSAILFGGEIKVKVRRENGLYKNGKQKFKLFDEVVYIEGFRLPLSLTSESKVNGRYKTGTDIIEKIYKKSTNEEAKEYCRLQKEAMNLGKMSSTYLEAFLNLNIDKRLYPNFNTTATATSRLSSSNPNLQNVPSKSDMAKKIQGLFIAPKGWKCVQIDFSQLEIYVLAWLSGDSKMTKDLLDGVDFHCLRMSWCTSMAQGKSYEEIVALAKKWKIKEWVLKRNQAKQISYQKAYGAGARSLAESTGLLEDDVKELMDKEDKIYYKVKGYNAHVLSTVENNTEHSTKMGIPSYLLRGGVNGKRFDQSGYELLPIKSGDTNTYENGLRREIGYYQSPTRKRYAFEQFGSFDRRGNLRQNFSPTQTKNYQIQGTASDVQAATSAALLHVLLQHSDKIQMVNEIHDSKWFYVKEEYLNKIVPQVCNLMESVPHLFKKYLGVDVPFKFPVDAEIGDNFAELTAFKGE
jgi:DNA polymerase I-like protein with 3'-5' exonuclease and polymerase domains